jgi:hypothetical protein
MYITSRWWTEKTFAPGDCFDGDEDQVTENPVAEEGPPERGADVVSDSDTVTDKVPDLLSETDSDADEEEDMDRTVRSIFPTQGTGTLIQRTTEISPVGPALHGVRPNMVLGECGLHFLWWSDRLRFVVFRDSAAIFKDPNNGDLAVLWHAAKDGLVIN